MPLKIFRGNQLQLAEAMITAGKGVVDSPASLDIQAGIQTELKEVQFFPTYFDGSDVVHAFLAPERAISYTKGLMDGSWLDTIIDYGEDPNGTNNLGIKKCAYGYIDDAGKSCGLFAMQWPGQDMFLYGLLRNTTADPKDCEVLVIASENAMSFSNVNVDYIEKELFLNTLHSKHLRDLFETKIATLDEDGNPLHEEGIIGPDNKLLHIELLQGQGKTLGEKAEAYMEYLTKDLQKAKYWPLVLVAGFACIGAIVLTGYCFPALVGMALFVFSLLALACFLNTIFMTGDLRTPLIQLQRKADIIADLKEEGKDIIDGLRDYGLFPKDKAAQKLVVEEVAVSPS